MKKKHIVLALFLAGGIYMAVDKPGRVSVTDLVIGLTVAFIMWGILVWGYNNPEARHKNKKTPE